MDDIVVATADGAVSVLTPGADGARESRTVCRGAAWPSWRPGRQQIAISVSATGRGSVVDVIEVESADYRTQSSFSIADEPSMIAPRVPHYVMWSPDGSLLSIVGRAEEALGLTCFAADGGEFGEEVTGAPIFSAWTADSRVIVVHAGPRLLLVEPLSGRTLRTISEVAVGFRAPAVSYSGRVVYAEARDGALLVLETTVDRNETSELTTFGGGAVLGFRPRTQDLTAAVASTTETGALSELWLVSPDGSRRRVARGPFVAYSWSPKGDKIALVAPSQSGDGRHYVRVIDEAGEELCASEAFVPSHEFRLWLAFFDQYSQSHPLWDAAGETLLLAGRRVDDSVHSSLGDAVGDKVYAWRVGRNEPLALVAPGVTGFFSRTDSLPANPER